MDTPEPFQVALFKDLMIPMRDGVRLAADIYRPARAGEVLPGPFPALLVRTSYDKQAEWLIHEVADCFTPRGFVLVLQDLRGRHRSEGTGQYFHTVNETAGTDGYDTVEWIAAQPWSNGRVGAMGSSHLGLVQIHMALYRPPHLRAIWPDVSPTNSYAHQVRWGGAMQLHMFGALFLHAYDAQEIRDDPAARQQVLQGMERMGDWVRRTPFQPGGTPLAAVPNLEKTLLDYYRRGAYDEFWRLESNDFEQHFRRHADIPGTCSGGWYDPFAIATTRYYAVMARQNRSPQRLVMGPWTHGGMRAGVSFKLWISSTAPDTDFTVKLLDVYPPNPDYPEGYDLNLVDGILRVRYRNGFEKEESMGPGEVYAIELDLPPTSNCFKAGHRIRVDVSSSNFPRFDVNPNTGELSGRHTRSQPARNTVYLDAGRPSHLVLPVIPRSHCR